jgi:hypothetical protein
MDWRAATIAEIERAPGLHPGIAQKVAPNESQSGPKARTREALVAFDEIVIMTVRDSKVVHQTGVIERD